MIPRTFPSIYVTPNGQTAAVVELITNTTGLTRWIDYIPVQFVTADSVKANTYENDGALLVDQLLSTSGKQAGIDYIKVFEDLTTTTPWSSNTNGYIPIYKYQDLLEGNLQLENGFNLLQEDGNLIELES